MTLRGSIQAAATCLASLCLGFPGLYFFGSVVAAEPTRAAARKPNVVIILVDDQGYGDLSCHGNPVLQTPHLDALHGDSVRLTDYHASPYCSPTRAALLTGRHCRTVGVHGMNGLAQQMATEAVTLADLFAANGYATGIFGKWHLGDRWPLRPGDRGFVESVVFPDGAVSAVPDHWGNDYVDDVYLHDGVPRRFEGYCTDVWFDQAEEFITRHRDRPFFCSIPTNVAHAPYLAPAGFAAPYRDRRPPHVAHFYGMLGHLDARIGRLRARLAELALDRDTILIFTTDNGTAAGSFNAGMRGTKGSPYDGGHRVPMFVRYPAGGLIGGRDVAALAAHIDVLPTLVDLCRLDRGPEPPVCDGTSLAAVLAGRADPPVDRVLVESYSRGVLTPRWRLVNGRELYDIVTDPAQAHDVAAAHPGVVTELRGAVAAVRVREDDRPPHVVVGSPHQDPVVLTGEDWQAQPMIYQSSVAVLAKPGERVGVQPHRPQNRWDLRVAEAGRFRFAVRRWPVEAATPVNAPLPREKWCHGMNRCDMFRAVECRLRIGAVERSVPVDDALEAAEFTVDLAAGLKGLEAFFVDDAGRHWSACFVTVTRAAGEAARPARPEYAVARADCAAIRVDGVLDEPVWRGARAERGFTLPWERGPPPATVFRAVRDDDHVAFAFEVADTTPVVTAVETFAGELDVANGDRVELFFAADTMLKRYVCIEIDPRGRVLDYAAKHYRAFDYPWALPRGLETAATRTADGYVVEGRIPWAALEEVGPPTLRTGTAMRVGMFRADFRPRPDGTIGEHWISWADPGGAEPDFHVPAAFGTWR